MKAIKRIGILFLVFITAGFAVSSYILVGIDDDGISEIDTLETAQPDEEIGFKKVASLISAFIHTQYDRRKASKDLDSRSIRDLPKPLYATRDVHRKAHGCFKASLHTRGNFVEVWNKSDAVQIQDSDDVGIFKPQITYDAVVRLSNGHPQNRVDSSPDARGFAVKILPQGTLDRSQSIDKQNVSAINQTTLLDILTINFPTFFVNQENTAMKYFEINNKFLPGALDFTGVVKSKIGEGLSVFTTGVNAMEAQLALAVNGSIIKSPLFQEYFSMVPSRLGRAGSNRAVKYIWSPAACPGADAAFEAAKKQNWPAWVNARDYSNPFTPLSLNRIPKGTFSKKDESTSLRAAAAGTLNKGNFCFTLFLQPYLDQVSTNIEDSTDIWLRSESERVWWLNTIIPSKLSPIAHVLPFDREGYTRKIQTEKKISPPIAVATLEINQLTETDTAANSQVCEDLSFNPWNGDIAHHKPLGVISRLKRRVYNASRRTRHLLNGIQNVMPERKSSTEN